MWEWIKELFATFSEHLMLFLSESGLKIILAVIATIVGLLAIKLVLRQIKKRMTAKNKNTVLTSFLVSILRVVLYVTVFLIVITILGIPVTSFLVIFSTVSIAVGLAFQSTLANFFSGITLIASKPFKIGDYVDLGGTGGTVKAIGIMNTTLTTPDNKLIILPNSQITGNSITNFSFHKTRRVELQFRTSYDADIAKVKEVILAEAFSHPLVIDEKYAAKENAKVLSDKTLILNKSDDEGKNAHEKEDKKKRFSRKNIALNLNEEMSLYKADDPAVKLLEIGASTLNFSLRVWTRSDDFWTVFFDLNEQIVAALNKNGILLPFNTMDINIKSKQ